MKNTKVRAILLAAVLAVSLCGCTTGSASASTPSASAAQSISANASGAAASSTASAKTSQAASTANTTTVRSASGGILDTSDLFTDRDLSQSADLADATYLTVANGQDISITDEGVYVISGTASGCTITVNADSSAKVQLVLDGVSITNSNSPAIYVLSADKVFVTTAAGSTNTLTVSGTFAADGDTNVDAVIFSKDDLVLNGGGTLTISSSGNGISGKDDVKITGGTYTIDAANHAIEGKDSVLIADGTFNLTTGKDGIHCENDDDATLGSVYICGGTFNIDADSDGIEAMTVAQIDGGTFSISCEEGIEGTYVQINDGTININASDDGINATFSSNIYTPTIEINGGKVTVSMAAGDTDALDSNGNLFINGGTVDISAQSPFDYDGQGQLNGGTVYVNGQQITQLTSQMMGGGMGGSRGSMDPSMSGQQPNSMGGPQGSMGGSQGGRR